MLCFSVALVFILFYFLKTITEAVAKKEHSTARNLISQGCVSRQEHEQFITWHVAHAA